MFSIIPCSEILEEGLSGIMRRGKKKHEQPPQQRQQQHGRPLQRTGDIATPGATPSLHINRTHTKLPTKRQKLRQQGSAEAAAASGALPQQLLEGELLVVMPRNFAARLEQGSGRNSPRGSMQSAGGGRKRSNKHPASKGISHVLNSISSLQDSPSVKKP